MIPVGQWSVLRRAAVFLITACVAANAFSALPSPWSMRAWQSEDGLPEDNVTGVAQTPEGYLWVTTHNGLARFDGVRFVPTGLPLPSGHDTPLVRSLLRADDGSLWLALELEGGMVIQLGDSKTNRFTVADGLPSFRPLAFAQASKDDIWLAYADGSVCRFAGGKVARYTAADGLAGVGQCWLTADRAGRLWFAKAGRVGVFQDGSFQMRFTLPDRDLRISSSRDGGLWICGGKRLFKTDGASEPKLAAEIQTDRTGVSPSVLYEDRDGGLWIGTQAGGLFHFDGEQLLAAETSHSDINSIMQDREGNIWVGTGGAGLNRIRNRIVELHGAAMKLPFEVVRSVCEDTAGGIWAAGANGALARLHNDAWETIPDGAGWYGQRATCVCSDGAGGVWVGTYRGGLYRFTGGKFISLRRAEGLAGDTVRSLLLARNGDLWITFESPNAIQRLHDGQFKNYTQPEAARTIRTMVEDAAGNIWMGSVDGNLLRVDGDAIVDESNRALRPTKPIRALHATPDGSLWIGYAGMGLGVLRDGRFSRISADQGLHDNYICSMISDGNGVMWFSSGHGIFHVRERALDDVIAGRAKTLLSIVYGRNEALPNLQGSYGYSPTAAHGKDGRVWFASRLGVIAVNAERVQPNHIPPKVLIERLLVDGQPVALGGRSPLRLAPGHRRIEIEYTALSFAAPESIRFRHQLQDWDADWIHDGVSPQRSVAYTRIPTGSYEFHITACNNAGIWNETGAVLRFVIDPFFWQTWWFRIGAAAAFTLIVVGVVRYVSFRRLRARLQKLESEAALNKERARIARDIHDDVGASFAQIALLGELTRADIAEPAKTAEHVEKMTNVAREGINALDEIVWAVNPNNDTLAHFFDYASQYAVDFLRPAGVRCRVDMPHQIQIPARNLPANVRHGLFLVVKESLHNVLKHSQAKEVWFRVKLTGDGFTVTIEDDGCGFASAPDNALADGLRNMRERMAEIGGACAISSRPGAGTTVKLSLPWKSS